MLCRNEVVKLERYSLVESLGTYVMCRIRSYNGSSDRNINGNLDSSALRESLGSEVGTNVVPSYVIYVGNSICRLERPSLGESLGYEVVTEVV